jgi:hypothetical protein
MYSPVNIAINTLYSNLSLSPHRGKHAEGASDFLAEAN